MEVARFRSCFGTGGMHVATTGGRHPGSAKRTPFTRPPRNRSWRPSSHRLDSKKSEPRRAARRRRQGCQRRSVPISHGGRKRHRVNHVRAPKWESRREARFSPASFVSEGPEPTGACLASLRTGEVARDRDVRVNEHGVERLRNESGPRMVRDERSVSDGDGRCAGKRRSTSARVGTVSECRSRSDASPVATPMGATKRITDTRDLARRNRMQRA